MKDKDLEAFEKWLEIEFGKEVDKSRSWNYEKSIFRFACEYKEAENKKLREALNYYANKYCWNGTHIGPSDYWFEDKQGYFLGGLRAREALKEIDEKL